MPSLWMPAIFAALVGSVDPGSEDVPREISRALDDLTDDRFDVRRSEVDRLAKKVDRLELSFADIEQVLREGRYSYPKKTGPLGRLRSEQPLRCDHVDYDTTYELYVPEGYTHEQSWPLVLVGHGGNSEMSQDRAERTAKSYISTWLDTAEEKQLIVAAPATARGWGRIGNSVLLSLISHLQRRFRIDPDRIYATGHSMGGHMSWRCGIGLADRWGAIGPMSGGYDYVENEQVYRLFNVPGYATFGKSEPYQIADFNRKIWKWMQEHDFPWIMVEKNGGHEIFADEIPKAGQFFLDHPRDLYRDTVFVQIGANGRVEEAEAKRPRWSKAHKWKRGRPLLHETFHWVRALPVEVAEGERLDRRAVVRRTSRSSVEITAQGFQSLRLYLHPKMFDLDAPLTVTANGRSSTHSVTPSMATMLDLVREFDDRGRLFHAELDVEIVGDEEVGVPTYRD